MVKGEIEISKMDSKTPPSHAERFHTNAVGLGELIHDVVKDVNSKGFFVVKPGMVEFAVRILECIPNSDSVINTFIQKSNVSKDGSILSIEDHCWTKIRLRDRSFFINNAGDIFSGLPGDRIEAFSKMFGNFDENGDPVVPEEDEDEIWLYFESFVKIAIKYVHENRKPSLIRHGSEELRKYDKEDFFPEVDLAIHAGDWGLILVFPES